MGMVTVLHTLGDENVRRLLLDPPLVWKVVSPDDLEFYEEARREDTPSFLGRLFGKKQPAVQELELGEDEVREMDLDKSWHGIHYLLCGEADGSGTPLHFLVSGGREVGTIEVGYGPARVFTSAEVREISAALAPVDAAILEERYDPVQMTKRKIYPEIWDRGPEDGGLEYCLDNFAELKSFLEDAARDQLGIVVTVT